MGKQYYAVDEQYRPLSAWGYVGYSLLFCIPCIGLVLIIVFALSDNNFNRRNYARSYLCWMLIAVILLAIIMFSGLAPAFQSYFSQRGNGLFSNRGFAEESEFESLGDGSFSEIIPSASLWGASIKTVEQNSERSFQSCKIKGNDGLFVADAQISDYPANVYYVFENDMGKYNGLSKIVYVYPNEEAHSTDELRECRDNLTTWICDALGNPTSQKDKTTTWKTSDCTVQIGAGRFTDYTGYNNLTVAIVIKENPNKKAASPSNDSQDSTDDKSANGEKSQFTGPMVTVKIGNKTVKIHRSFKELMDSYESFFSSYFDALAGGNYMQLINLMAKYDEMITALDALDDADLTSAEMAYYVEVYARIMGSLALYE